MLLNLTPLRYARKFLKNTMPLLLQSMSTWMSELLNSYTNVLERDDRAKTYTQTPPTNGSGIQGLVVIATVEQAQLRTENVTSRNITPPYTPIDSGSPDLDGCLDPYAYAVSPKHLPFVESPDTSIIEVTVNNPNGDIGTQYVITINEWILNADIPGFPSRTMDGLTGQKTFDDDYIYFCVEVNEWERTLKDTTVTW